MRCTINCTDPACRGECADGFHRPLTAGEQARLDAYMDRHHPRVFPAPTRKPSRLHVVTPSTNLTDKTGCSGSMTCSCVRCEQAREQIRPQGSGNADPFRRAA